MQIDVPLYRSPLKTGQPSYWGENGLFSFLQPTLSVHNSPRIQPKGSLQTRFTYTPRPSMKLDAIHEGLPPPVPSHTSAATAELSRAEEDEEFWSAFCESGAEMESASKKPPAELDEFESDRFEQEGFFSDEDVVGDSYETCDTFLLDKAVHGKEYVPTDSKNKRPCVEASSRSPFQYYQEDSVLEDDTAVKKQASSISLDFEKQREPVFLKKRKRMIDEIYGVENESYDISTPTNSTAHSQKYASGFHKANTITKKASSKPPQHTRISSSGFNAPFKANFPPVTECNKENSPPLQKSLPHAVSDYSASPQVKATLPPAISIRSPKATFPHASRYSANSSLKTNLHSTSSYGHQSKHGPLMANFPSTSSYSCQHKKANSLPTSSGSHQRSPLKANFPPGTALPAQKWFGYWGEPQQEPPDASRPSDGCGQRSIPEQVLKHVPCAPAVPAACSFFTAGTVDT